MVHTGPHLAEVARQLAKAVLIAILAVPGSGERVRALAGDERFVTGESPEGICDKLHRRGVIAPAGLPQWEGI